MDFGLAMIGSSNPALEAGLKEFGDSGKARHEPGRYD
jgi:hypothetical protein